MWCDLGQRGESRRVRYADHAAESETRRSPWIRGEARRRLCHAGHYQPTALAFGNELASPLPLPHRAVSVLSDLGMAAILALFARTLLPSRRKGPDLATGEAAHPALGVNPFLEPVGREAAQLPKAGGVGNERPYRSRRLGEITFLASFDRVATLAGIRERELVTQIQAGLSSGGYCNSPLARCVVPRGSMWM